MVETMTPLNASWAAWGLWLASWLVAASWAARVANRPVFGSQTLYNLITIAGVALLFTRIDSDQGLTGALGWSMFAVVVAGFAFCWWARVHLGAMWSGSVTRKADHHIVDTGPYGLVRHPIYTGLIVSAFAQAALVGKIRGLVGAALIVIGFFVKARLEEAFLRQELGPEVYDAYRARVPMLIPWKLGLAKR
jgi:protein-S-isoprenylcysteine O-methyltransferase Ste14